MKNSEMFFVYAMKQSCETLKFYCGQIQLPLDGMDMPGQSRLILAEHWNIMLTDQHESDELILDSGDRRHANGQS